jgi:glycosyl transferase family 25
MSRRPDTRRFPADQTAIQRSMDSLLTQFPAAYLINLPERTDRLRSATEELSRVGWTVGTGGVTIYPAQKFTDRGTFPSIGERGAFASHLGCLRDSQRQGQPNMILLEDDISFASALPKLTMSILRQLENTLWDFCYLGHEQTGDIGRADARTTEVQLLPYRGDLLTAHFVLIHGRVLSRLIAHLERVASGVEGDQEYGPMPVDGAYNIFRRNTPDVYTLIAVPKLGWQRPSRSDINPRSFDNWPAMQSLTSAMRQLKYVANRWRS